MGRSDFTSFRGRDLKPDPPVLGFWSQDPSLTARAIGLVGFGWGPSGWVVDLDRPVKRQITC